MNLDIPWVLPPLSYGWTITIIGLYIALNRTPNIDGYWVGAVPKIYPTPTLPGSMPRFLSINRRLGILPSPKPTWNPKRGLRHWF